MAVSSDQALDLDNLAARFDGPGVSAIALMGSHARGEAGPFSDIDLLRLVMGPDKPPGDGSHWIGERLVTVSTRIWQELETIFQEPEEACNYLLGLQTARILVDREGRFAAVQRRALAFRWDEAMQARANRCAAAALVGWIEEVHKGLEGLRRRDVGRLLHAAFGMSWGLSRVVMVQRGVLQASDNDIWRTLNEAVGPETRWARLRRAAFGLETDAAPPPPLEEQVRAGLALYGETVALMEDALPEPERGMILATVERIRLALGESRYAST